MPLTALCQWLTLPLLAAAHNHHGLERRDAQVPMASPELSINGVSFETRAHWMRTATGALSHPCPFAPFGTAIVNHTSGSRQGNLICTGENSQRYNGNPTMHGEMAGIANCSAIMTDPSGPYNYTAAEALAAFADLTLYTNGEPCPMCAAGARQAGFRELVYATSIPTLIEKGWGQIRIYATEVFAQSFDLPRSTRLIGDVLANETDPLFSWQFDPSVACPGGCSRSAEGDTCEADEDA